MNLNGEFTDANVAELRNDPDTHRVFIGQLLKDVTVQKVYDKTPGWEDDLSVELESDDYVLITIQHDGTSYINFMSWDPNVFHYRALIDNDNPGIVSLTKEL